MGIAIKLSETPGRVRMVAPSLGEHTDDVIKDLGYSQSDIQGLREKGVSL